MSRPTTERLIDLCLLAYPRAVRASDRDHLRDLAVDLATVHGPAREALGLLRGGLAERWRRRGATARVLAGVAAAAGLLVVLLGGVATAGGARVEDDRFACVAGQCRATEAEVDARTRDGWTCDEGRDGRAVTWRCHR